MKVVIRVDASLMIGSGHVMRCLVLADALAARGACVRFVCREHPGHLGALVVARGHAVSLLATIADAPVAAHPAHAHWLGANQESDAAATLAIVAQSGGADLLVVDHYALDATFERALRPAVGRIAVIDDLADRPHDCDVLLDQTVGREPAAYRGLVPKLAQLLLGVDHALVPPAFADARRPRDGTIRRILIFFGGVDATNAGLDVLRGLGAAADSSSGIAVDVLVGSGNAHRGDLESFAAGRSWVRLLSPQPSLAPLLGDYDLAIGAGGVAAVERALAGLPSLTLAVADNQIGAAAALASAGAIIYLGRHDDGSAAAAADALRLLQRAPELVRHVSACGTALGDGRGVARVLARLMPRSIALRRAEIADGERMWGWRNHPDTRRHSADPSEIPLDRHMEWLNATLARTDRDLLIGSEAGSEVGVLRYDVADRVAVVSVYLDPARRGGGLGVALLDAGSRWLAEHRADVRRIEARVLTVNGASRRAFLEAGYAECESLFIRDIDRDPTVGETASYICEPEGIQ